MISLQRCQPKTAAFDLGMTVFLVVLCPIELIEHMGKLRFTDPLSLCLIPTR